MILKEEKETKGNFFPRLWGEGAYIGLEIFNWDIEMLSLFARSFLLAFLLLLLGGAGDALLFGWLAR